MNSEILRTPRHIQNNRHRFPWLRTVLASVLGIGLFVGVAGALFVQDIETQVQGAVVDMSKFQSADQSEEQVVDSFEGRPVNLLITGIDSRYGDNSTVGAGSVEDQDAILTDTNMILHLSADRKHIYVVSVPRDLLTEIPDCTLGDGTVIPASYGMFNSAFQIGAAGDDIAGGIACSQATAETLTGLSMDGFAIVDFTGFQGMIKTLGGVDICIDEDIDDPYAGLKLEAGCHRLDPTQALGYARARKTLGDGSDIQRIGRQQQLLGSVMQEVTEANLVTDILKLRNFLGELFTSVVVSPSLGDLRTDVGLAHSIESVEPEDIQFVTLPWTFSTIDPNRVEESEPLASQLWAALRDDTALPEGVIYKSINNEYFQMGPDGTTIPGTLDGYDFEPFPMSDDPAQNDAQETYE